VEDDLQDTNVIAGLLDIVCIFWVLRSKELSLKENDAYRSMMEKKGAKILTLLFKHFKVEPPFKIPKLLR
jgi:hypothetical protein